MAVVRIPLLAVDGGGTKCLAVLADRAAREVGQGRSGSCNYQGIGEEAAARELVAAIRQAMEDAAGRGTLPPFVSGQGAGELEWEVDCAVFGIAGLDTEHDRRVISQMVSKVLDQLGIRVHQLIVENDGFAALLGATGGKPGILVIAGTGSIAFGVNEAQETARAGGWGHRVGDEGSGYWIGKQAIMAVLRAADGRGEPTLLKELLLPHVGLARVDELFNWTYSEHYSVEKVGELSPLVSQAALAGDQVAAHILQVAGEELFAAARAVIEALDMKTKPFQMIMQGGVLQNDDRVRKIVVEHVQRYAAQVVIENAQNEPIYGVIAKGLAYLERQSGSK
ncbi:BadF/BadG/BcrA/BcrD ATPase family protein [Brevibacillus agri]|uniref:N-acetylglucosamine kinase n=1 Tax=Brevibacillus agri TaxID=51101 RepID=A0A3M8AGC3_9BACL|nr:BadF/BadG/BcrA/BcrD ATPase family protein [Brevibacillus agri]MED1644861.1 BadF/BadG/BcrA/BcrD ATPase family protein [Brevibacillus agri]MED1654592.1 BadF/BadG/BcrA/BcrD ATPase family protein [Brevibacillus agri]MED1687421.1 BadF/BadG/BcrA/BcrD ATPase family protein [Brevibacillus agri]MED1691859.1 BadF/BadG/BcrA/BcrD ATPase family protein [Brevibacillus agri]MED1700442.1 BadF/BadG/BcrA/BcrD ATPase family protein [Brevibacillus agri]